VRHPVEQHPPQQEIQTTGLSVQAPSSSNKERLKVASAVHPITTVLSEAVSEKNKIIIITEMVLNKKKWLPDFIVHSKL
jgi:hypothetical protein